MSTAPMNGAQALMKTLVDAGIEVCFTNPGTSEMHFVAALDSEPKMRAVLALFEGVATGAADGYARMAGKPAATLLHLGCGLGNGLANLHNARKGKVPVVNIVGDHATHHTQYDAQLQSDIETVARNVSPGFVRTSQSTAALCQDAADAIIAAREAGILAKGGGHAMAAGCTLDEDQLDVFEQAFHQVALEWLDAATLTRRLETDGPLAPEYRRADLVDTLHAEVWGQGFEAPVFCDEVQVLQQRLVGEKHMKLRVRHAGLGEQHGGHGHGVPQQWFCGVPGGPAGTGGLGGQCQPGAEHGGGEPAVDPGAAGLV